MKKDLNYYMNLNYPTEFQKIIEDDGETYYRITVPRLPGLIAYGNTLNEGKVELEGAKKSWFSSCLRRKIKIPEPKIELEEANYEADNHIYHGSYDSFEDYKKAMPK